ncbi:Short-chain dehydrogenase/reductase SDR [Sesbania bispinosa]|nr:Short-chain dehydrogenase/reductase SDR [Sesbania bispinosa]
MLCRRSYRIYFFVTDICKGSAAKLEWNPSPEPFHFGSFGSLDLHHEEEDAPTGEDEDTEVQVAPIIKLEVAALSSGEEDDEPILNLKAKLYCFDKDRNQWKERGVGTVKILNAKVVPDTVSDLNKSSVLENVCGLDRCIWISSELKELNDDCKISHGVFVTWLPINYMSYVRLLDLTSPGLNWFPAYVRLLRDNEAEVRIAAAGKVTKFSRILNPELAIQHILPHPYTVSKHVVCGLTKNVVAEFGKHGIRVNCVSPYSVLTPLVFAHLPEDERTVDVVAVFRAFIGRHANLQGVN